MTDFNSQLRDLCGLWIDPSSENLARVPDLCNSIEEILAGNSPKIDGILIFRAGLFAAKARQRIEECVAIQSRTGSYSVSGTLEVSPKVATTGWEG